MKKIIKNIALVFTLLSVFSCSNVTQQGIKQSETPDVITKEKEQTQNQGIATVRMFVPDYYALAEQKKDRAIAPQTTKARLSYLVNGSWVGINTIDLSAAKKTPLENAPEGFSGSVYTCTFSGVPVGIYNAGNLQIEFMDAGGNAITSGTNSTSVTITKGAGASTAFYTVPLTTGANTGNLAAGEMKFSNADLVKGIKYPVRITSSGDYPDLVLFKNNGQLYKYLAIDSQEQANVTLTVDETDVYYLGLWADDGNAVARYSLAFDFGSGTQVGGVLTGNNLTWTKANSPYFVNANLLVREGSELTIEPGVIVQFTGDYYLKVNGVINAVGSKTEPVIFVQSGDNLAKWSGISIDSKTNLIVKDKYSYVSGNILKNCMVIGAKTPLSTNSSSIYIDSCTFTGNENAVELRSNDSILINNIIDCGVKIDSNSSNKIINNIIKGIVRGYYENNLIKNNTISDAAIDLSYSSSQFVNNIINGCVFSIYNAMSAKFTGNNFLNYNGTILNMSINSYASQKSYNFAGNYWGEAQTLELNQKGDDANISFFNDYYDNFEWAEIDYSNWATEPIEGTGYQGDDFIAFDYTINGYNYDNGSYYPESTSPSLAIAITPQYHVNDISSVRIAQSLAALKTTEWNSYSASQSFTVDKTNLVNDVATIYVQLKDSKGNISSPVMYEVPFDKPVVTLSIEDGTVYTTATSSVALTYGATDNGKLIMYEFYLDGEKLDSNEVSGKVVNMSCTLGLAYMPAGLHTIKLTFLDIAGNSTTKTVNFTIKRSVNTEAFASSFDSTTGQLLKDSNTVYLWHFDGNGNEAGNNTSETINSYNAGTGALGEYAASIYTSGSIPLSLENAFTIEFWRKGNNNLEIYQNSVFSFTETGFSTYYKTVSGSLNYNSLLWNSISDSDWHFYSFVYNGSYMAVYCDGVLLHYKDNLSQTLNTNDNMLYINAKNIDELRISKVARSADEIAAYYNAAKTHVAAE